MREIKFQIIYNNEIIGEEKIVDGNWHWMVYKFNPDGKEKWNLGYFPASENLIRRQFIGLKDKNGKEIFEGDIINTSVSLGVVEFDKGLFGINWDWETERKSMLGSWGNETNLRQMYDGFNRTCEVIGNIYEHPHLLSPQVKTIKG